MRARVGNQKADSRIIICFDSWVWEMDVYNRYNHTLIYIFIYIYMYLSLCSLHIVSWWCCNLMTCRECNTGQARFRMSASAGQRQRPSTECLNLQNFIGLEMTWFMHSLERLAYTWEKVSQSTLCKLLNLNYTKLTQLKSSLRSCPIHSNSCHIRKSFH